ncbi:peptidase M19 [Amylibacter kogurei]|uniref:Peptidase M19 n=1 Tax=Paramylibacter kogurei TaxID=1889778 RepID=A0A2G5K4S5_9RHOB|nr:membrane dipeptidase [Amylibacter kogurei]PIB24415.1 peptidase M19 [Amylibacter kogurei]
MRFIKFLAIVVPVLAILGIAAFLIFAPAIVEKGQNTMLTHDPYPVSADAAALHETLTIGDWHADSLLWKRNLLKRADRGHVDIPRLQEGNVAIQMFTVVTKSPKNQNYEHNSADAGDNITLLAMGQMWPVRTWNSLFERAVYQAQKLHKFAEKSPQDLHIIRNQRDLEFVLEQRAAGKSIVGGLLGIEGSHPLEGDIENLDRLIDAGYRMFGLQHFFDNELGGSLHGVGNHGLTDLGRAVVRRLNDENLILDLAHSSPKVAKDVLEIVDTPIVVSHTGIYNHCPAKRNYPNYLMKEIAQKGGVIAIGYWADVTCDATPKGVAATINAAIKLLGEDHVSLGSDYDGSVRVGYDTSELAALTHELIALGLTEVQIRKVMGENMIRVLRDRLPE